jgi:hypothetical protein
VGGVIKAPGLPERRVDDHIAEYFDYFYDLRVGVSSEFPKSIRWASKAVLGGKPAASATVFEPEPKAEATSDQRPATSDQAPTAQRCPSRLL